MNRYFNKFFSLMFFAGIATVAQPLTATSQAVKVCVYDLDALMAQSKEWNDYSNKIDTDYQKKFDEVRKEEDSLRDAATNFKAKATMLTELARESEQDKLLRQDRDLKAKAKGLMEDYNAEKQKAGMRFLKKLEEGISSFAQLNNYDLIIPKAPGVFALARTDKTNEVVALLNKTYEEGKKSLPAGLKTNNITVAKK